MPAGAVKKSTVKQQQALQKKNAKLSGNKKGKKGAKKKWGGEDSNKQKNHVDIMITNMKAYENFEKSLSSGKNITLMQVAEQLNITRSCAKKVVNEMIGLGKMVQKTKFSDSIYAGVSQDAVATVTVD